jgi:hypothetical protein
MLKMIFKRRAFALQNEGVHRNPITATITNASVPTLILLIALVVLLKETCFEHTLYTNQTMPSYYFWHLQLELGKALDYSTRRVKKR